MNKHLRKYMVLWATYQFKRNQWILTTYNTLKNNTLDFPTWSLEALKSDCGGKFKKMISLFSRQIYQLASSSPKIFD